MILQLEEDYVKGKMTEDEHFIFLKEHYNEPNLKQNKRYSTFDFNSENITIELKKRNFESTKYKDLMIGLNKIEKAQKANIRRSEPASCTCLNRCVLWEATLGRPRNKLGLNTCVKSVGSVCVSSS